MLGLPIANLAFRFLESSVDPSTGVVTWVVEENLGIGTEYNGLLLTIHSVIGSLSVQVSDIMPSLSSGCDGEERLVRTLLSTSMAPPAAINISTTVGDLSVAGVTLTASANEQLHDIYFSVGVRPRSSASAGCGVHYQKVGSTVTFTADISSLRVPEGVDSVSYTWHVPDGVTLESADGHEATVTLPEAGNFEIAVDVVVTTRGGRNTGIAGRHQFAVLTPEEARFRMLVCEVWHTSLPDVARTARGAGPSPVPGIVDPLWDPAPHERIATRFLTETYALSDISLLAASLEKATKRIEEAKSLLKKVEAQQVTSFKQLASKQRARQQTHQKGR